MKNEQPWTEADVALMRELVAEEKTNGEIASALGRPKPAVAARIQRLRMAEGDGDVGRTKHDRWPAGCFQAHDMPAHVIDREPAKFGPKPERVEYHTCGGVVPYGR